MSKSKNEKKYFGHNACQVLFEQRPQDIVRIYIDKTKVKEFSKALKWCAQEKRAYHVVAEADLNKVVEGTHHEGICILAKERPDLSFDELLQLTKKKSPLCVLLVDGVENPHNFGALVRTCAHFGIRHILGEGKSLPGLHGAAARIAEGGAEFVTLIRHPDLVDAVKQLKKNEFPFYATAVKDGSSLYKEKLPSQLIVGIGSESVGMRKKLLDLASKTLTIPGSGNVESLNVASATAALLSEIYRQRL